MWFLEKDIIISASHHLKDYDGKCANLHGHSWNITVYCKGSELDGQGILVDFTEIKEIVNEFDHQNLNDLMPKDVNPTAENLAKLLCDRIPSCYKVRVQEEVGSRCTYTIWESDA